MSTRDGDGDVAMTDIKTAADGVSEAVKELELSEALVKELLAGRERLPRNVQHLIVSEKSDRLSEEGDRLPPSLTPGLLHRVLSVCQPLALTLNVAGSPSNALMQLASGPSASSVVSFLCLGDDCSSDPKVLRKWLPNVEGCYVITLCHNPLRMFIPSFSGSARLRELSVYGANDVVAEVVRANASTLTAIKLDGVKAGDHLAAIASALVHAPLLESFKLYISMLDEDTTIDTSAVATLLGSHQRLSSFNLTTDGVQSHECVPILRAIAANPHGAMRSLAIDVRFVKGSEHLSELIGLLTTRPNFCVLSISIHIDWETLFGSRIEAISGALRLAKKRLLFDCLQRYTIILADEKAEEKAREAAWIAAMQSNPLLCAWDCQWGFDSHFSSHPDALELAERWAAAKIASDANWQAICVAVSAMRTRTSIALSILPLLPIITRLVGRSIGGLDGCIQCPDAIPTVHIGRFLQTRFAAAIVNERATPSAASAAAPATQDRGRKRK